MEWAARIIVYNGKLLILGFREVNFILWSYTDQRTLLEVFCGGGHRSWDFKLEKNQLQFVYIREKSICEFSFPFDKVVKPVLQPGFHIKEINSMKRLPVPEESCPVLISGSEDTTIRVIQTKMGEIQTLATLRSHISSVRTLFLCALPVQDEQMTDFLVFSAGGRALMKVWRILVKSHERAVPSLTCHELASHMLRGFDKKFKKPWKYRELMNEPEARYMDLHAVKLPHNDIFLIVAACSDAFLRLLCFDLSTQDLWVVGKFEFHKHCLLKASYLQVYDKHIAVSMATDGKVALWDVSECVGSVLEPSLQDEEACGGTTYQKDGENRNKAKHPAERTDMSPFFCHVFHQSGINSFDSKELSQAVYLLASGGDDTLLVLSVLKLELSLESNFIEAHIITQWEQATAHHSQITGIKILDKLLLSTAVDQRLTVWDWHFDAESNSLQASYLAEYCSTVADIHGMDVWKSGEGISVCLHGKGMEVLSITVNNLTAEFNSLGVQS